MRSDPFGISHMMLRIRSCCEAIAGKQHAENACVHNRHKKMHVYTTERRPCRALSCNVLSDTNAANLHWRVGVHAVQGATFKKILHAEHPQ